MLLENSLGFSGQARHGQKQSKTRVTVFVGANMDGTDKLPLLVIGKSAKPRAFKNVNVPVTYLANNNAWVTSQIFVDWLKTVDRRMKMANRKIAMIVGNCSAHPTIDLENIEIVFLPPNTTVFRNQC